MQVVTGVVTLAAGKHNVRIHYFQAGDEPEVGLVVRYTGPGLSGWNFLPESSPGCLSCPANSTSPVDSTSITACIFNARWTGAIGAPCVQCPAGAYRLLSRNSACLGCASGKFCSVQGGTSEAVCTMCSAGKIPRAGADACMSCIAGTYSAVTS